MTTTIFKQENAQRVLFKHTKVKSVSVLESTGEIASSEYTKITAKMEGLARVRS
jgi:hypothetical protein